MTLGENIVRLRTQKNWSQGDLADALEISRQSVSKWETDASIPELDKLLKLSELFGVTLDELVRGEPADDKPRNLFFRCGQLERTVGAHRADDHHEHSEKLHPRDSETQIVHLIRPEVRHEDGCPRKTGCKTEIEINTEIDRPAAAEANTPLHSKADDAADEER